MIKSSIKQVSALVTAMVLIWTAASSSAAEAPAKSPWGDFVEKDFPFFSSVLDARKIGEGWPTNNLTPRGLILNLGHDCWACFDTDLLRVSAIWQGADVTPVAMSYGSYKLSGYKIPEGQKILPEPNGKVWLANGLYPGWQTGEKISLADPRPPAPDIKEVGRGPIDPKLGQFKAVRLVEDGVILEYTVTAAKVQQRIVSFKEPDGAVSIHLSYLFDSVPETLSLILGRSPFTADDTLALGYSLPQIDGVRVFDREPRADGLLAFRLKPTKQQLRFSVSMRLAGRVASWKEKFFPEVGPHKAFWPKAVFTAPTLSTGKEAYVMDDIPIPDHNPWKRNIRFADIAFFTDGRAAFVTFDGDVWIASGLKGNLPVVTWKRFAAGFHEPLGLAIRKDEIFVNDRNGLWRLVDSDKNGEADIHEMFCNLFAQTAETREFAAGVKVAPDGSFVISKGGQQGSTIGKYNGTVLRIAADGKSFEMLGWGFREPFIGVHPKTGMVTVSDQQGNYVPATPLYILTKNEFHGFLTHLLPKEQYPAPIAEPLTWIPHPVNSSGMCQVWLTDAKMGGLNDALIHFGYNRPEMFLVRLNERGSRPQAAVISFTKDFAYAPMNGAVNPADGQLYVTGMQSWGTTVTNISGITRVRYTGAKSSWPREIVPMDKGVLLRFDVPLDATQATNLASYSLERWNYQRTAKYGSPHFKLDGSKGTDPLAPSSVYLAKDSKSVFIGIPDMKPVMQMRVGWGLAIQGGTAFANNA